MRVAVLSEAEADEAFVRPLVDAILGKATEPVLFPLRHRGWPAVLDQLPAVMKYLYYNQAAEGLVVVVDSNNSAPHGSALETLETVEGATLKRCRLCVLTHEIGNVVRQLRQGPGLAPLKTAVGLAVPMIEAWLLCGKPPHPNEALWTLELSQPGSCRYSKADLRTAAYGSDRAPRNVKTSAAIREATRLAADVGSLERSFPKGFGEFASQLRAW